MQEWFQWGYNGMSRDEMKRLVARANDDGRDSDEDAELMGETDDARRVVKAHRTEGARLAAPEDDDGLSDFFDGADVGEMPSYPAVLRPVASTRLPPLSGHHQLVFRGDTPTIVVFGGVTVVHDQMLNDQLFVSHWRESADGECWDAFVEVPRVCGLVPAVGQAACAIPGEQPRALVLGGSSSRAIDVTKPSQLLCGAQLLTVDTESATFCPMECVTNVPALAYSAVAPVVGASASEHYVLWFGGVGARGVVDAGVRRIEWDVVQNTLRASPMETFGDKPAGRYGHSLTSCCGDGVTEELFLFGGEARPGELLADCAVFEVKQRMWRSVCLPFDFIVPPRAFHASCWSSVLDAVLLVGGDSVNNGALHPVAWRSGHWLRLMCGGEVLPASRSPQVAAFSLGRGDAAFLVTHSANRAGSLLVCGTTLRWLVAQKISSV